MPSLSMVLMALAEIRRRTIIKLVSTAGTGHFYTTTKNPKKTTEKLLMKKFDPTIRKHVDYKESKV